MCGICCIFSISKEFITIKDGEICKLISARGPDVINCHSQNISNEITGFFRGCVLWLQGSGPEPQPIVDDEGNVFLWNGDNYNSNKDDGVSDSRQIFDGIRNRSTTEILQSLSQVRGPWSLIYYSSFNQKLYFGRDVFGRRSLLWNLQENDNSFILTSVAPKDCEFSEVPALGLYVADVKSLVNCKERNISLYRFKEVSEEVVNDDIQVVGSFPLSFIENGLCKSLPSDDEIQELKSFPRKIKEDNIDVFKDYFKEEIRLFSKLFEDSIRSRVAAAPNQCKNCDHLTRVCDHVKYAVLFSGGLDSAMIAFYLSKILPETEAIDLLNVSFQTKMNHQRRRIHPDDPEFTFDSPDRLAGLLCLHRLEYICPGRRWNFVEINVTPEDLKKNREETISHLISPHNTVLDDSIGCALFFGGRGRGVLLDRSPFTSSARVLFSGFGADEQLAGYSRHRGRFEQSGFEVLLEETEMEISRIHARNGGRDDRVLSHYGRVVRFPFLDEEVVSCLNSFKVWKKSNLYLPRGVGEKLLLRVLAASCGLWSAVNLPKRAIQFGSRIAKMENRNEKGGDTCKRLV